MDLVWLVIAVLLWGLIHSLLAGRGAKALATRLMGPLADRLYRLLYNVFAAFSFVPVLVLAARADSGVLYSIPWPWSGLMVAGQILAVVVLVVAFLQTDAWEFLGLRQLGALGEDEPLKLFTGGFYRYVRHPLYAAGLAFIWLMPYMTASILIINAALTVYVVVGALFEEAKLRRTFGQVYADYAAVTPMLIPFTCWRRSR
jgi:protein-S-isoprenylcysteine O-methyltransferase Ste14